MQHSFCNWVVDGLFWTHFKQKEQAHLASLGLNDSFQLPQDFTYLGHIDTLMISHNHYDHLCWHTVRHLPNRKTDEVISPTGLVPWF
tara:strand:- start:271 stop:531 length:261 start_codon:yes stop_codon:yes gene_type:complete